MVLTMTCNLPNSKAKKTPLKYARRELKASCDRVYAVCHFLKQKLSSTQMSVFDRSSDRPSNWLGICDNDVNFSSCCKGSTLSDHRSIISPDPCDEILSAKEEQTKKREMDVLLAQAMTGLTLEEREETQEVIHGVMEEIIEDTAEIDNALQDLNGHLSFIKRGSMYEMAESMDPKYVNSRAFRMMFLRANEYDPKASAEQMIKFFELKHHLFGVGKLTKDIRMEDLNEEDIACLKDGWVQLGGRDRSRRQIIVIVASLLEAAKSLQIAIRVLYFVLMRTFQQSDETQIRGNISIWYSAGQFSAKANGRYCEAYMAAQALPQKKAAIHFCVEALRHVVLSNSLQMVKVSQSTNAYPSFNKVFRLSSQLIVLIIYQGYAHQIESSITTTLWFPHGMPISTFDIWNIATNVASRWKRPTRA